MSRFLVASNDKLTIEVIKSSLGTSDTLVTAPDAMCLYRKVTSSTFDFVIADISFIDGSTCNIPSNILDVLRDEYINGFPSSHLILLCPKDELPSSLPLILACAKRYLTYPVNAIELNLNIEEILRCDREKSELETLRARLWRNERLDSLLSNSPLMVALFKKVRAVSPTNASVLLTGESGTGKGVVARLIHRHSSRADGPFIDVHCGAIPDTLIESELFGHERGAFTGAHRRKLGKFEIAAGGTIFLDEIGAVTPLVQIKLLQVLQEGIFYRVGAETPVKANVRIIAATNSDLPNLCERGSFRQDLYYRLNVFGLELPPLAHRVEDMPLLIDTMLIKFNSVHGKGIFAVHPKVLDAFFSYRWPGNIRELENVIERAYIVENSSVIMPSTVIDFIEHAKQSTLEPEMASSAPQSLSEIRKRAIEKAERTYLVSLLKRNVGNMNACAKEAKVGVRQLRRLVKRHELDKRDFLSNSKKSKVIPDIT